jgi:hypothetical protein
MSSIVARVSEYSAKRRHVAVIAERRHAHHARLGISRAPAAAVGDIQPHRECRPQLA